MKLISEVIQYSRIIFKDGSSGWEKFALDQKLKMVTLRASEVQQVRVSTSEAWGLKFNLQKPHIGMKNQMHEAILWPPQVFHGVCAHTQTHTILKNCILLNYKLYSW